MKHFIYPIAVAFLVFEFGCGGGGNTTPPPPPPADFSVSVTNTPINLPVDGNVQVNVAVKSINGFSGAVTITSPGNSGDVNYGSPITVAAGSSGNITMSAVQAALLGDRNFVLKATSGSIEHDLSAKLTVVLKVGNGKILGFSFENVPQNDQTYLINLANQKWIPALTAILGSPVSTFTLTIAGTNGNMPNGPYDPMSHRVEMWVPSNPLWDDSMLLYSLIRAWTREVYYFLPPQVEWPITITAYEAALAENGINLGKWNNYFPAASSYGMNFELVQDAGVGGIEWRNLMHILFETQTVGDPRDWSKYDALNRIVVALYEWANTNQRVPQLDAFLSVVDDVCTQTMMDESGNMVSPGTWLRSMPQMKQVFVPGDYLYIDGFTYDGRSRPVSLAIRAYQSDVHGNLSKITSGFVRITMTSASGAVLVLPDFDLSQTSRYIDLASTGNFNGAWFIQSKMYADNQWTGGLPTWTVTYPEYYPTPTSSAFNYQPFPWATGGLIYLVGIKADGTISDKPLPAIPNGHFIKNALGNDINHNGYAIWQADTFQTPLWIDLNPGVRILGKVPMGQFSQFVVILNP